MAQDHVMEGGQALGSAQLATCPPAAPPPQGPNLLVDSSWRVKVTDFNLSKLLAMEPVLSRTSGSLTGLNPKWCGACCWPSGKPEVLECRAATAQRCFVVNTILGQTIKFLKNWSRAPLLLQACP